MLFACCVGNIRKIVPEVDQERLTNLRENGFLKPPRNVCGCMNAVQLKFFFPQECTETIPVICQSRYALTVFETPLKTTF